jgi:hypothetical protein
MYNVEGFREAVRKADWKLTWRTTAKAAPLGKADIKRSSASADSVAMT